MVAIVLTATLLGQIPTPSPDQTKTKVLQLHITPHSLMYIDINTYSRTLDALRIYICKNEAKFPLSPLFHVTRPHFLDLARWRKRERGRKGK